MIAASEIEGEEEEEEANRSTVVFNTLRTSGSGTVVNINGNYIVKFNLMPGGAPPEAMNQMSKHKQAASSMSKSSLSVVQLPRCSEPPSDQITTIYVPVDPIYNSAIRSVDRVRVMVVIVQTMLDNPMLCSSQDLPETLASLKRILTLMELALQAYRHTNLLHSLGSAISIGVEECRRLLDELISDLTNYRQSFSNAVLYFIGKYVWARAGEGSTVHTLDSKLRKAHSSFAACLLSLGHAAWPELKRGMGKETLDELAKFYAALEQESTSLRHIKVDAVIVQDHLGRDLHVPMIFCTSSQDFHVVIAGFCSGLAGDVLIQQGNYSIMNAGDQVIDPKEFATLLEPGMAVTMSIVFHEQAEERQGSKGYSCPRCQHINSRCTGWVTCAKCNGLFKISPEVFHEQAEERQGSKGYSCPRCQHINSRCIGWVTCAKCNGLFKILPEEESSIVSPDIEQHMGTDCIPDERQLFRRISIFQAAASKAIKSLDEYVSPEFNFEDAMSEYLTTPMNDSPLDDELLQTPVLKPDEYGADIYNSPLMGDWPYQETYEGSLFDDQYNFLQETAPVKQPAPATVSPANIDLSTMWSLSPATPALEASPLPLPAKALPTHTRRKSAATGTRKNVTPETLVPIDAPTQKHKYVTRSVTSRKRARSQAFGDEQDELEEDMVTLPPNPTGADLIEAKRRQNTTAARRSRKRRLEYQGELDPRPRTATQVFLNTSDLAAHFGIPTFLPPAPRETDFQNICSNYLTMLTNTPDGTTHTEDTAMAPS